MMAYSAAHTPRTAPPGSPARALSHPLLSNFYAVQKLYTSCESWPRVTRRNRGRCYTLPDFQEFTGPGVLDTPLPTARYPGEHGLRLDEYMVVLDKPLGITLAPEPMSGQIVVQSIKHGLPAHQSGLVQVGDVLKTCSAVFGEDMWPAQDIRRVHWAINNRSSKVKLVFERRGHKGSAPTWYSRGQVGCVSTSRDVIELPVSFIHGGSAGGPGGSGSGGGSSGGGSLSWGQDLCSPGKPLYAGFHRCSMGPSQLSKTSAGKRSARLEQLRKELTQAGREPSIHLTLKRLNQDTSTSPNSPSAAGMPNRENFSSISDNPSSKEAITGGQQVTQGQSDGKKKTKKVMPVLPWLLVTSSHLSLRDLTHLASYRCLSALLELGLVSTAGHLSIRGLDWQSRQISQVDVSHMFTKNKEGTPFAPTDSPPERTGETSPWPPLAAAAAAAAAAASEAASAAAAAAGLRPSAPSPSTSLGGMTCSGNDNDVAGQGVGSSSSSSSSGSGSAGGAAGHHMQQVADRGASGKAAKAPALALIHAAAALHRLSIRRVHGNLHRAISNNCAVLLHCGPGMRAQVACLVAGWLHWFCHMQMQEAILSAEIALKCSIDQSVLEKATEELIAGAIERANRVTLTWRYGGISASVAGDVVGGWQHHVPLQSNSVVILNGLRPGTYYYKFIVDGVWAIDPLAPKVLDASGNWNNVLHVMPKPPVMTSKERLSMARWHAMLIAFETKMGL